MPDDYSDDKLAAGVVRVGDSATGDIETRGDSDWFEVRLRAGTTYRIDLEGALTDTGTLSDPYLRGIYDSSGELLEDTQDDDGGVLLNSRVFFTPADTGTYYIAAGAWNNNKGTYKLLVDAIPSMQAVSYIDDSMTYIGLNAAVSVNKHADDYGTDTGGAGRVTVGGAATGAIEQQGDRDWIGVTLDAGRLYRIDLEGRWTDRGSLANPHIYGIHRSDGSRAGNTVNDDGGAGWNSRVFFEPSSTGTYYIEAGAYRSYIGHYTLSVDEVIDDYPAAGTTGAGIEVGGSATGSVDYAGDEDWFIVDLVADTQYRFHLAGSGADPGALADPSLLGIYTADGHLIPGTANDDGGAGRHSYVDFIAPESAGYFIVAGAHFQHTGEYRLRVEEVVDDYPATTATGAVVKVGGSAMGEIAAPGDTDWFAVDVIAGREYQLDLEGWRTDRGTLEDPYLLGIYAADGTLIDGTTDDDGGEGLNSRVSFEAPESGTYYIAAGAYDEHTGDYLLSVEDPGDDYPASTGTTGTVAVDGSNTGKVDYTGDEDWFAVELVADREYQIHIEGSLTGQDALRDPTLYGIHDSDGNQIAGTGDDDGGERPNSRLAFTAPGSGTYYIAAGAFGEDTGAYRLIVDDAGDDYPASTGTTGTVVVGGSAAGEVDYAGDEDWFAVELVAGREYQIHIEGFPTDRGTLGDPYLYGIHDVDGHLLADTANDDGGTGYNSRLEFVAPESGTYYIAVGAFGEDTGTYTVEVADLL